MELHCFFLSAFSLITIFFSFHCYFLQGEVHNINVSAHCPWNVDAHCGLTTSAHVLAFTSQHCLPLSFQSHFRFGFFHEVFPAKLHYQFFLSPNEFIFCTVSLSLGDYRCIMEDSHCACLLCLFVFYHSC